MLSILNNQVHDRKPRGLFKSQACNKKLCNLSKFSKVRRATREFVNFPILSAVTGAIHTKAVQQSRLPLTGKARTLRILNSQIKNKKVCDLFTNWVGDDAGVCQELGLNLS